MSDHQTYTFSFYTKERVPVLEGKKFWQFWVKQKIGWKEQWVRKVYTGLSEAEAKLLMSNPANVILFDLISKFVGQTRNWVLEQDNYPTQYISISIEKDN